MHLVIIPFVIIVLIAAVFFSGGLIRGIDFTLPDFGLSSLSGNGQSTSFSTTSNQKQSTLQAPPQNQNFVLDTIITTPTKDTVLKETNKITFEFEGYVVEGITENSISFETMLDGVDEDWQRTSKNSRTIELPLDSNGYTFFVRATIGDVYDITPAIRTVFTNVSPFFQKLDIARFRATSNTGSTPFTVTLKPKLKKDETLDITGWKMLSRFRGAFTFPQGVDKVSSTIQTVNTNNMVVRPADTIFIRGEIGPFGAEVNFRTNICFGYLKPYFPSIPRTPSCSQEKPTLEEISYLRPECQEFILRSINFSACEIPDVSQELVLIGDSQCQNYVSSKISGFNYAGCYRRNSEEIGFTENRWYIYTARQFGHPLHDTITLYDNEDLFVDKYQY